MAVERHEGEVTFSSHPESEFPFSDMVAESEDTAKALTFWVSRVIERNSSGSTGLVLAGLRPTLNIVNAKVRAVLLECPAGPCDMQAELEGISSCLNTTSEYVLRLACPYIRHEDEAKVRARDNRCLANHAAAKDVFVE